MILIGLVHIAVSTLFALTLTTLWGHLTPLIAALSLFLGLLAGFVAKGAFLRTSGELRFGVWADGFDGWIERILFAFLFYISARYFLFMFYPDGAVWKSLNPNNLGDLPLHINYIRAMSLKNSFPLVNPEFAFDKLRYPLGVDLYNALWDILGVPLQSHLFLVGLFGATASLIALRAYGSWWAMLGVFLSGGWAGWEIFNGPILKDPQSLVEWKNIFTAVLTTQRGFIYALPVGVILLQQFRAPRTSAFWYGILWGSMGLFHMHTFMAVSLMIGGSAIIHKDFKLLKSAMIYAVPLGSVFVFYETGFFKEGGFIRWAPGWSFNPQQPFILQFTHNFGPYFYLFLLLGALLGLRAFGYIKDAKVEEPVAPIQPERKAPLRKKSEQQLVKEKNEVTVGQSRRFYLYLWYIALFGLFMNLILAPWPWDNIKVLIWPYIGLLGLTAHAFRRTLNPFVQVLAVFVLGFSGYLAVAPSLISVAQAQTIFENGAVGNALGATRNLRRQAVFLASTSFQHPLAFWGRIRIYGYEGHVWSHGIKDTTHVKDKLTRIMSGDADWHKLALELKADYIYWGPDEVKEFGSLPKEWQLTLRNVSPVEGIGVYEIK